MTTVFNVDCIEGMRWFPDNTFDSIVTDPPYELGFMGKAWDSTGIANNVEMWREALRVLKPGGHLLAFSGTRTYHRMTCAIEDAGFEIRDQIGWLYGSGFPKSLDVSKAIDKARVEDVAPIRAICRQVRAAMDALGVRSHHLTPLFGNCHPRLIDHWAARDTDSQPALPTWPQWEILRDVLGIGHALDAEVKRLNARKGEAGDTWKGAEVVGVYDGETPGFVEHRFKSRDNTIREPSDAAKQWQGWGTALKPAQEPICVARKPLVGTVAANVLQFGTGALNIDGCRVATDETLRTGTGGIPCRHDVNVSRTGEASAARRYTEHGGTNFAAKPGPRGGDPAGRWPANIIHDGSDEVLEAFAQFGENKGQAAKLSTRNSDQTRNTYGAFAGTTDAAFVPHDPLGSAARFFYCAKASRADRDAGLQNITQRAVAGVGALRDGARQTQPRANIHPTVKPTDLMRYLVRLVTPPGGSVLDPFTGSGSTGRAAAFEGFAFIGFELDPGYCEIARARIDDAVKNSYSSETVDKDQ